MAGGRPPIYESEDQIKGLIDEYFNEHVGRPTISGLAYHLGFDSRKSFYNYAEKPEFLHILKRARLRIEIYHEERLSEPSCTGSIFFLKNSKGADWNAEETKKVEHSGNLPSWLDSNSDE